MSISPEQRRSPIETDNTLAIDEFLRTNWGISADMVNQYPLHERALLLRNTLVTDEEIATFSDFKNRLQDIPPQTRGVALIKPELSQNHEAVHNFFDQLGCNPTLLPKMHLSHEQWMSIYADRINDFPEIMFLYVTQRALGMTPVLFDYPPVEHYERGEQDSTVLQFTHRDDLAELFDSTYCGRAFIETPGTVRWEVVRPTLERDGFTTMDGFASDFDPFEHFRTREPRVIFGSFNGVHLPDDSRECAANMLTLFG